MYVVAIIPAFNEERTIGDVIEKTRPFVHEVLVVNDGSTDRTGEIARLHNARVVSHPINRGLGASLGTGFHAVRLLDADVAITLDADGQHDPCEIPSFLAAIQNGADLVLGTRMRNLQGMPFVRRLAQWCGNVVTFCLFGAWVSDSQSGYRALSHHALEHLNIQTNRMEVSSEIVAEGKRLALKLAEVPIRAIYTDYSLSKGQGFFVGLKTLAKLIIRRIS